MNLANNLSQLNAPSGGSSSGSGALVITGRINGGAPPAVVEGAYYIVTTAGGAYALKSIYLGAGGAWTLVYTAATMPIDQAMVPSVALAAGTDTYAAETLYFWDSDTSAFVVDGSAAAAVAVHAALTTGVHGVGAGTVAKTADITKAAVGLSNVEDYQQLRALGAVTDGEIFVTSGTGGAATKRITGLTGVPYLTAGVPSIATLAQLRAFTATAIKTGNYTCSASYEDVRVNPTGAGFWVKPIAVPADRDLWMITNEYPSVNGIVVTANTATVAQTIEGLASITIGRGYFCILLKYNLALLSWTIQSIN